MEHGAISVESIEHCRAGLTRLDGQLRQLRQLNFFRAAGVERRELYHSNFLKFLLTPSESHGLGASFLKQFLLRALRRADPELMSELSYSSLAYARVEREEDDIDLLIVDESLGLGVVVENKIDAPEHGDQLEKYWSSICQKFPRLKWRFGVLLSPNAMQASHLQYSAFSYTDLAEILQHAVAVAGVKPGTDAGMIIRHYIAFLRRELMENPLAVGLAWEMWRTHRRAIDFITNNSPTTQITKELSRLLAPTGCDREARRGREGPKKVAFTLKGWREHRQFQDDPLRKSGYQSALLFWFDVNEKNVRLLLGGWELKPGLPQYLENMRCSNDFFAGHQTTRADGYRLLWSKQFLSEQDLKKKIREEVVTQLRSRWSDFWRNDVPKIERAIRRLPLAKRQQV